MLFIKLNNWKKNLNELIDSSSLFEFLKKLNNNLRLKYLVLIIMFKTEDG